MNKRLGYGASAGAAYCVQKAVEALSWKQAVSLGALLGKAAFRIPSRQKKTALANLAYVFGGSEKDYMRVGLESFESVGKGFCETLASEKLTEEELRKIVSLNGEGNLKKALAGGRGVIGFSAHTGNFTLIGVRLALEGYDFNYVFRYPSLGFLADSMRLLGRHHGVGFISALPRGEAARGAMKSLRRNEIVCILADQNDIHGVTVDFFNRPAATPAGPAVLAMRTGAAIVPMFAARDEQDRNIIFIEPEFKPAFSGSYADDIKENTRRLNGVIEAFVRKHPGQWWWMHRRWRES